MGLWVLLATLGDLGGTARLHGWADLPGLPLDSLGERSLFFTEEGLSIGDEQPAQNWSGQGDLGIASCSKYEGVEH